MVSLDKHTLHHPCVCVAPLLRMRLFTTTAIHHNNVTFKLTSTTRYLLFCHHKQLQAPIVHNLFLIYIPILLILSIHSIHSSIHSLHPLIHSFTPSTHPFIHSIHSSIHSLHPLIHSPYSTFPISSFHSSLSLSTSSLLPAVSRAG